MKKVFLFICLLGIFPFVVAQEATIQSPDDAVRLEVNLEAGIPTYSVFYNNEVVLEKSRLGLKTNISDYSEGLSFEGSKTTSVEKSYESKKLKDSEINYNARELTATFATQKGQKMDVIFRVSNNDIAFRYRLQKYSDTIAHVVTKEFTGFNFPNTAKSFLTPQSKSMVGFQRTKPSYEEGYYLDQEITKASANNLGYTFPGLFKTEDHWVLLSETGVDGTYVGAHLSDPNEEGEYTIAFPDTTENNDFGSTGAAISLPYSTPWRTITIGESLKPIVETTIPFDVVEPLYEASQDYEFGRGVWSWIMWQDGSMNYDDQVTYIDFAAEMGYEYILIDALWDQNIGYDRMEELIDYAKSKNVDVFLWYNSNGVANDAPMTPRNKMHRAITRKQEMQWLQENGVKGLKVDFMGGDKQETIQLYEDIMSDANDYGLMMIFHGATIPRGWEVMYPNFISTEAVLASENLMFSQYANDQEARSAAIHPFIRNTVGSMDFGGTVLNERYNRTNDGGNFRKTSDAFQLATAVLFQTPVQFFALTPNNLEDAPEFAVDFMKNVPTTWDETIFIEGYPGEYSVIARRHEDQWYIAGINASKEAKKVSFSLPEVEENTFSIINDSKKGKTEKKEIKQKRGKFEVTIQPQGGFLGNSVVAQQQAQNPIIHADVPDASIIRVDDSYYMSSTTMHMNPGVPIMKSKDLVNWEIVNYAYDILGDTDALNLENGENAYGRGSWASSLRYHNDTFYVSTFSSTTGKTYIFKTKDIENGSFEEISFTPSLHDSTLFFDDDGKTYLIWGGGKLNIVELKEDLSGVKEGTERVLIENATEPIGSNYILPAEGSQIFKANGKYYLFNIAWPRDGMRTVIIHRADKITGPYEGKLAFQDKGVAQGGLIDTPEGDWFAYLFRDYGAVGRIPYLVPVKWENGWPVLGENGKVPETLDLPANKGWIPGIVASDDFSRKSGDKDLPLVWQWNHNPQNDYWSVKDRKGYLRLTTDRVDTSFLNTRNTLTQRAIGPESSAITKVDLSGMKEGDYAGLGLLQKNFGFVGAKMENNKKHIIMVNGASEEPVEVESIPLNQEELYLKAVVNFQDRKDKAEFSYSLDGKNWKAIGNELKMSYTLPHFMGYRFALFNYATKEAGGHVDFDYFKIEAEKNN